MYADILKLLSLLSLTLQSDRLGIVQGTFITCAQDSQFRTFAVAPVKLVLTKIASGGSTRCVWLYSRSSRILIPLIRNLANPNCVRPCTKYILLALRVSEQLLQYGGHEEEESTRALPWRRGWRSWTRSGRKATNFCLSSTYGVGLSQRSERTQVDSLRTEDDRMEFPSQGQAI